jgi:hypothetical protein
VGKNKNDLFSREKKLFLSWQFFKVKGTEAGEGKMSGPDATALETILPEVHDIFSERAAERDLAMIKKVKKIEADTRQIVANREAEIKEVVRGKRKAQSKKGNRCDILCA